MVNAGLLRLLMLLAMKVVSIICVRRGEMKHAGGKGTSTTG